MEFASSTSINTVSWQVHLPPFVRLQGFTVTEEFVGCDKNFIEYGRPFYGRPNQGMDQAFGLVPWTNIQTNATGASG
jgi:hypothetical protein